MNARIFFLGISIFTLSACSSLSGLLTFGEEAPSEPAVVVAAQPVAAPQATVNDWCQRVAASDQLRAQQQGYDSATLDRLTLQSFQQCAALDNPG